MHESWPNQRFTPCHWFPHQNFLEQYCKLQQKHAIMNELWHTLLPAIETTDAIGNTENKQVKRNMSKYFQRMFMLISLSLGYLFYDTYS